MPPRTVAVVGAVCLTIGWLLASTLSPPVAQVQSLPDRQPKANPVADDVTFTERLHVRMRQLPLPPVPRRNPFSFGDRPKSAPKGPAGVDATPDSVRPQPPVGPAFSLSGIGVTAELRTAVLTDGQAVHVVRAGDRIGDVEVVEVTDTSVTIATANGAQYVLRLR